MDIQEMRKKMRDRTSAEQKAGAGITKRPRGAFRRSSTIKSSTAEFCSQTNPMGAVENIWQIASKYFRKTASQLGFIGPKENQTKENQTEKSHTGTRGLYGHIQENNKKSFLFLTGFLFIILYIQFSIMSFFVPLDQGPNYEGILIELPFSDLAKSPGANAQKNGFEAIATNDDASQERKASEAAWDDRNGEDTNIFVTAFKDFGVIFSVLILNGRLLEGWIFGLLPATLYVLEGLFLASYFVRRQTRARRITSVDEPRLFGLVERLTRSRGLPMPKVEIIESSARNAYASGFTPANSVIGVTRGLLEALNDIELEAVLAHEIAHIEARDNRLMTISKLCTGYASYYVNGVNKSPNKFSVLVLLAIATSLVTYAVATLGVPMVTVMIPIGIVIIPWLMSTALNSLISQKREFMADARAIEIMKSPAALISALTKVARNDHVAGLSKDVQAMMISNLSGAGSDTHPSTAARIRAIEETTTVNEADIAAIANSPHTGRRLRGQNTVPANPARDDQISPLEDASKEKLFNFLMNVKNSMESGPISTGINLKWLWLAVLLLPAIAWLILPLILLFNSPVGLVAISLLGLVIWRFKTSPQ